MFTVISAQKQSQAACWLMALLALCLCAAPARAQEALLTSDVSMDITGADASDARAQAMKKAEREGLGQLLDKLAPDQKAALLPTLDDRKISSMVKGVEVLDEKIAGPRYRALLRVSYNAIAVSTLLERQAGAPTAAAAPVPDSHAVLVIPLYQHSGKTELWEPGNAWQEAWKRVMLETRGGALVIPYGDETDGKAISAATLPAANYAALAPFFQRYGVGEVIIVKAGLREDGKGVDVMSRRVAASGSEVQTADYRADPQEDTDALLTRAARDTAELLLHQRSAALSKQAMAGSGDGRIMVVIPFSTLAVWTKTRAALQGLQTITHMDITALSASQADAMLQYRGPPEGLKRDLEGAGLRVVQMGNYWVLSRE